MAGAPVDPNALKRMEAEARKFEQAGDILSALDIYEDIVAKNWARAPHLTALGFCYMKTRQRQNARKAWLNALEIDPNYMPCLEALNRNFTGWEEKYSPGSATDPGTAQSDAGRSAAGQAQNEAGHDVISFDRMPSPEQAAPPPRPAQPRPAHSAAQRPASPGPQRPAPRRPAEPARAPAAAAHQAPTPQSAQGDEFHVLSPYADSKVNWDYVLKDVEETIGNRPKPALV